MICALLSFGVRPPRRFGRLTGLVLGVLLGTAVCAHAQPDRDLDRTRTAGSSTNLFASFEFSQPTTSFDLDLPGTWQLTQVSVLRYGSEPIPATVRRESSLLRIQLEEPVRGPVEMVLRVQLGERSGRYSWDVTPRSASPDGSDGDLRSADRRTQTVILEAPEAGNASNRALRFSDGAEAPLLLAPDSFTSLTGRNPFTIEFWMRTVSLDAVVLSTWTGEKSQPYPLEIVTDAGGRLRAYTGRSNHHQSLRSRHPVADGEWNHVGVSYDPQGGRMRLFLNGNAVDSLSGISMPLRGDAPPLAIGGRLPAGRNAESPPAAFAGLVDEMRVWNRARRSSEIRRFMRRSEGIAAVQTEAPIQRLGPVQTEQPPSVFVVDPALETGDGSRSLSTGENGLLVRPWPAGVEMVPSTLQFQEQLRDLQARTDGEQVTLAWEAPASTVRSFVVERSTDGQSFTQAATIRPNRSESSAAASFSYTDEAVPAQVVYYRIRQVYETGTERVSGTLKIGVGTQDEPRGPVDLIGNFPNPFDASTTVCFEVHESVRITLTVWDVTGQQVTQLADQTYGPGYYEIAFDARSRPSGTYFLRLETPDGIQSHRMVVLQ